jgi:putative transcriptional regulator
MDNVAQKFLIASEIMDDPNFARSVILMLKHDEEGAMGLIVNRPLQLSVAQACGSDLEAAAEVSQPLHVGGPCPGPMFVLHNNTGVEGQRVLSGVRCSATREQVEEVMLSGDRPSKYIANYAAWAAGQLESELKNNFWHIVPARAVDVFDGDRLWHRLMDRMRLSELIDIDLRTFPTDPQAN